MPHSLFCFSSSLSLSHFLTYRRVLFLSLFLLVLSFLFQTCDYALTPRSSASSFVVTLLVTYRAPSAASALEDLSLSLRFADVPAFRLLRGRRSEGQHPPAAVEIETIPLIARIPPGTGLYLLFLFACSCLVVTIHFLFVLALNLVDWKENNRSGWMTGH